MKDILTFRTAYLRLIAEMWSHPAFEEELLNSRGVNLAAMVRRFGFELTDWPALEVGFAKRGPIYDPNKVGWVGHGESELSVYLPLEERKAHLPDEDEVLALTDYYRQRPTVFGPNAAIGVGLGGNLGNWADFIEFGAITIKALALAWADARFRRELQEDGLRALEGWLRFKSPWNLTLRFRNAAQSAWDREEKRWNLVEVNSLTLDVPERPREVAIRPIALSDYNNSGAAYPFTCCA